MPDSTANPFITLRINELPIVANPPSTSAASTPVGLLTRGLAAGQEDAFREFHRLYFDRLYRFLLAVTHGQEQEAQEALQETFLRLLRKPRIFDDEEIFWSWLRAVARNAARDAGRKHRRYFALLQTFALVRHEESPEIMGGEDSRMTALLEESLDELEPGERRLIEAKYVDGESIKELSALAGMTEKAVESRLFRLRRQLRERILAKLKK